MQNEITASRPLLDSRGRITEEGWARRPFWDYDRDAIRASRLRIKEWDYYAVLSESLKRGITFTFSDLGYAALMALCWLDFEKGTARQADAIVPLSLGRFYRGSGGARPTSDEGVLSYTGSKLALRFECMAGKRWISFRAPDLEDGGDGRGVEGELLLEDPPGTESMNIATSWAENRSRFYYNRKINGLKAGGVVRAGEREYMFKPETDFGVLDWGRGAWTYRNRWFWSSASGRVDGRSFGFNLGYGFSDRTPASENILFADGRGHKLGEVVFRYDEGDYMAPWRLTDDEGRLELDFHPVVDRFSSVNLALIRSVQHQVFGRFSGRAVLDDGTVVKLNDFPGFAEDVNNRW